MTLTSTNSSPSIFENGKLKPGTYKIQNIYTETYLDIEVHSREVCCRPEGDLGEGRGLWEIEQFGAGYTVQRVDPGKPEQFCTTLNGVNDGAALRVNAYPVAWRIETVDDDNHRGFEYVRFSWATTKVVWDLAGGSRGNGSLVYTYGECTSNVWQIWRLIPVKVGGIFTTPHSSHGTAGPGSLPSYDGDSGGPSTRTQHVESESDELGTFVNEVTVVTTTVTTRKRYRVEDTQGDST